MALNWNVKKDDKGKFVRRKLKGDVLHDLDYIDVEWTSDEPFPEDTIVVPVTHPPDILYETRKVGRREVVHDQIGVMSNISDATVAAKLDEKREALAKALGVKP